MSWSRREQIFPGLTAFLGEKEYIIWSRTFRNWRKKIPALSVDLCYLEQIASLRDCGCACRACASLGGGDLEKCLHILALSHPNSHSCARERYSWITLQHHILPPCCSRVQIIAHLFFCQSFQFYIISKLMKVYTEGLVCVLFWNTFWKTH